MVASLILTALILANPVSPEAVAAPVAEFDKAAAENARNGRLSWYGWQTLLAFPLMQAPGAMLSKGDGLGSNKLADFVWGAGMVSAGPLVDWYNGDTHNMWRSIAINSVTGILGMLALLSDEKPDDDGSDVPFPVTGQLIGAGLLLYTPMINSAFAWKRVPYVPPVDPHYEENDHERSHSRRLSFSIAPSGDGLQFGLVGSF